MSYLPSEGGRKFIHFTQSSSSSFSCRERPFIQILLKTSFKSITWTPGVSLQVDVCKIGIYVVNTLGASF